MGILGLLQYTKKCRKERHLRQYKGKTAAVDTYAWLHKIIKGPSGRELILGGPNRYRYVNDCIKRINKIQSEGVKVIMVFDGGPLPGKRGQEEYRKKRRDQMFEKGKELLEQGDEAGFKKLVDAIDISPDIAYRLIVELKKKGIQYVVAPYEADAQLAYLSREGIADVIITEDSDLMAFGAKKMLYKLDFQSLVGQELDLDEVRRCMEVNFTWFTHCMFLTTCILSGCDYLSQINGIGLKTAQKYIGRVTTFRGFLGELGNKSSQVPPDYELNFMKAFLTFRFQRVFCPRRRTCVELNDMSHLKKSFDQLIEEEKLGKPWSQEVINVQILQFVEMNSLDFSFLGEKYSDELMCRIADAEVNPVSYTEFDHNFAEGLTYVPTVPLRTNSIVNNARKPSKSGKPYSQPFNKQTSLLSNYLNNKTQQHEKFDPSAFSYKSLRNGENYEVNLKDEKQVSAPQLRPIKKGLMFRESEQESQADESPIVSEMTSQQSIDERSSSERLLLETRSVNVGLVSKSCKDELEHIADQLFIKIFTQEYLERPFSH